MQHQRYQSAAHGGERARGHSQNNEAATSSDRKERNGSNGSPPSHQLLGNLETQVEQLVDARPRPRFEGTVAEPWPGRRSGHIPGSRNVPYAELFDARTGAMKPLDELRKAFAAAGVDTAKPIVTTCGSGVSALVLTLALYRLGVRGTALYDGSWAEWGLPDGPPLATGPA